MNGQWLGPYTGTNKGLLILDLDDAGDRYEGTATALDSDLKLPPMYVDLSQVPIPKEKTEFDIRAPLTPIDRISYTPISRIEIEKHYSSDVKVPEYADIHWKVRDDQLDISWKTDAGTFGDGTVFKSKGCLPSTLAPEPEITNWEQFRHFARTLEPFRYIFRGQTDSKWRLRTAFHRTGRSSLVKFTNKDIPVLHRHLIGMMEYPLDLRDPFHYAAFYNLVQHHGFPTPLLDWTYSPFIAAYFAYKGAPRAGAASEERIRLFVFDKTRWCQDFEAILLVSSPRLNFTVVEPLALNNPRVIPQQSVSSVTNIDDIEAYIAQREKDAGKRYLRVIDLPVSERNNVLQELGLMGITAGSLFPGIDGACEQVRERFFTGV